MFCFKFKPNKGLYLSFYPGKSTKYWKGFFLKKTIAQVRVCLKQLRRKATRYQFSQLTFAFTVITAYAHLSFCGRLCLGGCFCFFQIANSHVHAAPDRPDLCGIWNTMWVWHSARIIARPGAKRNQQDGQIPYKTANKRVCYVCVE